jgi:hypothetical protein
MAVAALCQHRIFRYYTERLSPQNASMNNNYYSAKLASAFLGAAPFLAAIWVLGAVKEVPPAIRADYSSIIELTVVHAISFLVLFGGANIMATFSVSSVADKNKAGTWYIVRQAIRFSVAALGVYVFYLGGSRGLLAESPWLYLNLGSMVMMVISSLSDFPNDENLLDRERRLGL